jgi:hypothetical protein
MNRRLSRRGFLGLLACLAGLAGLLRTRPRRRRVLHEAIVCDDRAAGYTETVCRYDGEGRLVAQWDRWVPGNRQT